MLADLDLLLTAVFAAADDLLPERQKNARRSVTDAEVVTLAVAQAIMDITSDREFLAVAAKRLGHLFPKLPLQPGYWKRRSRCSEHDRLADRRCSRRTRRATPTTIVLIDSTPVECGRSVETARRSALAAGLRASLQPQPFSAGFGACACTCSPPRTARRGRRSSPRPKRKNAMSRCGCLRVACTAASVDSADKGYDPGKDFDATPAHGETILRPRRADEPGRGPPPGVDRCASRALVAKDRVLRTSNGMRRPLVHGLAARTRPSRLSWALVRPGDVEAARWTSQTWPLTRLAVNQSIRMRW